MYLEGVSKRKLLQVACIICRRLAVSLWPYKITTGFLKQQNRVTISAYHEN